MMRGISKILLVFGIIVFFNSQAFAVPDLQVYIPTPYVGAHSDDWLKESWVTSSTDFELWVIAAKYNIYDVYLPMAVPIGESGSTSLTPFGSGASIYSTSSIPSAFSIGTPSSALKTLPDHGIYETLYAEHSIGTITGKTVAKFNVSVSGFSKVHFDAYGYKKCSKKNYFTKAPFSHDSTYIKPVPEPATMSLLGLGLLGVAGFKKRFVRWRVV